MSSQFNISNCFNLMLERILRRILHFDDFFPPSREYFYLRSKLYIFYYVSCFVSMTQKSYAATYYAALQACFIYSAYILSLLWNRIINILSYVPVQRNLTGSCILRCFLWYKIGVYHSFTIVSCCSIYYFFIYISSSAYIFLRAGYN